MPTQYQWTIPGPVSQLKLILDTGQSIVIIGANGSGKTRLGVHLESQIRASSVHRIAAQKSLTLNDNLSLMSFERADRYLRYGTPEGTEAHKVGSRWGNKPATHFLSDFDALLQALFGAHSRVASKHLQDRRINPHIAVPTTKLDKLKEIWDYLLPHRTLEILEASVKVLPANTPGGYPGSEMSDGERAIFYFLGQCLVAPDNGIIIIDEPENHVHKAILRSLWDTIEKARPDCGFIYITHDLDFAVARTSSAKYFIRTYNHLPLQWDVQELPENTGLPEDVVAELVGSRRPILFVEGDRSSLDLTIYGSMYPGFTIVPVGSCEAVVHSVASYKGSTALHWLGVQGIVDGDDREVAEGAWLREHDVHVLPVAEVENLLILPSVFLALAEALMCGDPAAELAKLNTRVMEEAGTNLDLVSARHTIRQLDRRLRRVAVNAKNLETLRTSYQAELAPINPGEIFNSFRTRLAQGINTRDLSEVLRLYDNKGLLSIGAQILGVKDQKQLLEKVGRLLGGENGKKLREELTKTLPIIAPC